MHASQGEVPEAAQKGLKTTLRKQNLFLSCQCLPEHDMTVSLPDAQGLDTRAVIASREMLNHNVMRLLLRPESGFACEPGQFISLINGDGLARSYSVANTPVRDGVIELHIRLLKGGMMSDFLREEAAPGETVTVRGPAGNCFYVSDDGRDYPIVLAGTGTGLAPLYGIVKQALAMGHNGAIQLFHGALHSNDLYLVEELLALAAGHAPLRYTPCVLHDAPGSLPGPFYVQGNIEDVVLSALPSDKAPARLFLCGAPEFVNALKRKAFLAGLASRHIFADAFLPSKPMPAAA